MICQDKQIMKILRTILGSLCTLLVPLAVGMSFICKDANAALCPAWWQSVSDTWCTSSGIVMIGVLFSSAVVMFSYKGYDVRDRVLTLIQGAMMLAIIIFPCRPAEGYTNGGIFGVPYPLCSLLHCLSAGLLCAAQATHILWLFRLDGGDKNALTMSKRKRNKIYTITGIGCVVGFALLVFGFACPFDLKKYGLVDIAEFIWLGSYGIAWLTKSEALWLKDKK